MRRTGTIRRVGTPSAAVVEEDVAASPAVPPASARSARPGPTPLGTTLARGAGAGTAAVMVAVSRTVDPWTLVVLGLGAVWIATTSVVVVRSGWSARQARVIAVVDLALAVALIAGTGGPESTVLPVLWLAPIGWAVVTERRTTLPLFVVAGVAYLTMWVPHAAEQHDDSWRQLAQFASVYLATVALATVALNLRARAEAQAERLAAARTALSRELGQVERDERERLAIELHDGPLQTVISARQDLVDHLEGDPDALRIGVQTLDESIAALRGVATDLFPDQDGGEDVGEQLRSIAEGWETRGGFEVRLDLDDAVATRSDPMLVGMVAELVGNAAKHAAPDVVRVRIQDAPEGIVLDVTDDGGGMTPEDRARAEQAGHIGLRSLDRRIRAMSGGWQIRSARGQGTTVRVTLPR